jgi:glycosyltransferase involved in cell wall biosynthesis
MSILHVAAGNLYGGVERVLVEIARAAQPASHEFALSFEGRLARELDACGVKRHQLGEVRFSRPLTAWRARRRLSAVAKTCGHDGVVAHSPWSYALAAPALSPRRPVLWAHDALRGDHWTEHRVAARPPELVICNSQFTESAVAGWLATVRREVIYPPVAWAKPAKTRAEVRASLSVAERTVVIVMVSRFERWKGHAALLRAAVDLPGDWTIWIAGGAQRPHEREYEAELRALAKAGGASSRVVFLGERRDVPDLLAAADIHCQPNSEPEPFGLAFVEALHAGRPVVTTNAGGAREIVTPACGVLVEPGDPSGLRASLVDLISNDTRRRALGDAGPARARELCDPARQVTRLETVLRGVTPGVAA